eukprot:gnl/MRDRNA2_/MRDRNA2_103945_c0_seq1.p1 gnl/MRDRNA2_/MRDRNA2_103945_c0~~gnl/MRDRNA2_/MRDRNA2_103945_c0_seq1.p1  ORF type:complete len:386 (+),score=104.47 gnl/MRDRNA2_/MRDRNA2_103945_c0_seq1:78-1235(+)
MCSIALCLAFLGASVAQQCHQQQGEAAEGSCLLAHKKMIGKASLIQEDSISSFEENSLAQKHWHMRHRSVEMALNKSESLLDKFIKAQTDSSDHCSSRLMESKRVLDGILGDLRTLNKQVTSRQEVVTTETENLKITKESIKAVETEYKKSVKICTEEVKDATEEFRTYERELDELKSIANPSLRINIAHSVKIAEEEMLESKSLLEESSDSDLSLVQVKLDKEMCKAFLDFTARHRHHKAIDDPKKMDCDKQREQLQKAFEEAVIETRKLKKGAKVRIQDKTCLEIAESKKGAELVPLVSQRDIAIEKVTVASEAIAALNPVLNLVKDRAEKLRIHIDETLTIECAEAEEASELLEHVRELILMLEECPGRNDFKLKIPALAEE